MGPWIQSCVSPAVSSAAQAATASTLSSASPTRGPPSVRTGTAPRSGWCRGTASGMRSHPDRPPPSRHTHRRWTPCSPARWRRVTTTSTSVCGPPLRGAADRSWCGSTGVPSSGARTQSPPTTGPRSPGTTSCSWRSTTGLASPGSPSLTAPRLTSVCGTRSRPWNGFATTWLCSAATPGTSPCSASPRAA